MNDILNELKNYNREEYIYTMLSSIGMKKENKDEIKNLLLSSEEFMMFFNNHIDFKINMIKYADKNKLNLYYSQNDEEVFLDQKIYGKTEGQVKSIGGFSLLKTKSHINHFMEKYNSNFFGQYSLNNRLFFKMSFLYETNPILKKKKRLIEKKSVVEQFKTIDRVFKKDKIENYLNEIQEIMLKKETNHSEINNISLGISKIKNIITIINREMKISMLNEMFQECLQGNFEGLDKLSAVDIKELIRPEKTMENERIVVRWANNISVFETTPANNELLKNIHIFDQDEPEIAVGRLEKLIVLSSKVRTFNRLGYDDYEKNYGVIVNEFFSKWTKISPETLTEKVVKENTNMIFLASLAEKNIWIAEKIMMLKNHNIESSKMIESIVETNTKIEYRLNHKILKYFLADEHGKAESKVVLLLNTYGQTKWDMVNKYDKEIYLSIKKEDKLPHIDNKLLLNIIIENIYSLSKSSDVKDMTEKMQRNISLNTALKAKDDNKRVKPKI